MIPDSSAKTARIAARFITDHPAHLDEMLKIAVSEQDKLTMRASNVIYLVHTYKPDLIKPEYTKILRTLLHIKNSSAKRNLLRIFVGNTRYLSEEQMGLLMDISFKFLEMPELEVGPRVYAMHILFEISQNISEIKPELKSIIEFQMINADNAFQSMGRKILSKI